ncbi:MAG TPA: PilN domain-containing protein [Phycisphaerae bacterium]|nr:PilN domain-containing protein [Phycisphaerae bacterium]
MHVINFLPDDYAARRGLRRANWTCMAIAGAGVLLLGAVVALVFIHGMSLAATRAIMEGQYKEASRQIDDLEQLEQHKTGLLHKVELSTALLERVPRSHVLARLTNYLPANTSLTSMTMLVEQVASQAKGPAASKPGQATDSPAGNAADPAATVIMSRVRFRIDGLAKTDMEVADFMKRLGADPLFEDIDLQFSEEFPYQEGVTMRRFQMSLLLSRDAEKVLETLTADAVTAPGPAVAPAKGAL